MQPNRDAKAELNRRSQACEVLADTGISRRVKSERRVTLPLVLAPEASASLLGYALVINSAHSSFCILHSAFRELPSALNPAAGHYFDRARPLPADQAQLRKVVEHLGIAPSILAWKAGVYLPTPMLEREIGVP